MDLTGEQPGIHFANAQLADFGASWSGLPQVQLSPPRGRKRSNSLRPEDRERLSYLPIDQQEAIVTSSLISVPLWPPQG